jgi:hypothetical protein
MYGPHNVAQAIGAGDHGDITNISMSDVPPLYHDSLGFYNYSPVQDQDQSQQLAVYALQHTPPQAQEYADFDLADELMQQEREFLYNREPEESPSYYFPLNDFPWDSESDTEQPD